ncbi:triacylglycerol lipase [Blastococcus sp. URHD0036]|uniref:esterase/lipase family protein n=1 Tax=Blastococcus sp. URHD0036 TaxID=1380356 RepID=UPI0004961C19|nr:alpha/beta hydrolase [Blastococcus sp. URHD0036]
MRRDEVLGLSELAGMGLGGWTRRIAEFHSGIADRAFGAVGDAGAPVRLVHDAVAGLAYGGVGAALGVGARAAGQVATLAADDSPLDGSPAGRRALGVLNGLYGDSVARHAPGLAIPMAVRVEGRSVPTTPGDLAAAFPDAGDRLVVLLHGLTETEASWDRGSQREDGVPGTNYGTLLQRDLGLTPVFLRYNTGLHLSDNGRLLDTLLGDLVAAWPVPVRDVVLVGHSMGGLVARAALHRAGSGTPDGRPWTTLVRDTITLGSPHLGAPLERGAHALTGLLARLPETRPLSRVLALRSVGIKDLRRGTLVEDDWSGRDLDAGEAAAHTHVPLSDGARHFVVLATLTRDPEARTADLLGDLLVPPRSASGDTGDDDRLTFPPDHVTRLGGLNHFDLQSDPRVYLAIRRWLTARDADV